MIPEHIVKSSSEPLTPFSKTNLSLLLIHHHYSGMGFHGVLFSKDHGGLGNSGLNSLAGAPSVVIMLTDQGLAAVCFCPELG